jgi:hypothetical protein
VNAPEPPHCPGCNGFGPRWEGDCPGVRVPPPFASVLPGRMPWSARLRILAGRPVNVIVHAPKADRR